MANIFADNCIFLKGNFVYFGFHQKFCPINNKSALAQVMVWYQTGYKRLPEPMMTQFTDKGFIDNGLLLM